MPYIRRDKRESVLENGIPTTPGELSFMITEALLQYQAFHEPLKYQVINDILGALEGAKLEFYRRVAVPYEEKKRKENGDVYE